MFTAAMAYALGLSLDQIRTGLRTFDNTFFQSPGRMNIFDEHGFRVILDYGHNEAAVGAMVDLVERLNPLGRRIVCVTCPGDRRDEDIRDIAAQGRRALRHLHLPRRRQPARPRAGRGAEADPGGADRGRRARGARSSLAESESASVADRARDGAAERPRADLLRRASPAPGSRSSTSSPKEAPAPRAARALVAAAGLRRARGLPRASATSAASASCRRADRRHGVDPTSAAAARGRQARRDRRPARGQQRRGLRRDAPARRRPHPRVPDRLRPSPRRSARRALQVFRSHGFEAEVAPLTAANAAPMAHDPGLIARVARLRQRLFHRRRPGEDRRARWRPGGVETPLLAAIRAAQAAGGLVAGSSAGAAMMSQPMILGGTSIESVVHGVTDDPEQPGLLIGDGPRLLPVRHARPALHQARPARPAGRRDGRGRGAPRLRHRREHRARSSRAAPARVCGEYGVMLVDLGPAARRRRRGGASATSGSATSTTATAIDLGRFRPQPGAGKRRVRKREIAYRAPTRSRRNVFGAYTLYDLMARLVLGDPAVYNADRAEAFDARSGVNVTVEIARQPRRSRGLIATPESGLRMSALNFRCSLTSEQLSATRLADRIGRRGAHLRHDAEPRGADRAARLLAARAPTRRCWRRSLALVGAGPVGVLAAASAEPKRDRRRACRAPRAARGAGRRPRRHHRHRRLRGAGRRSCSRRSPACAASCSAAATRSGWSRRCCTAARRARSCARSPAPTRRARR